MSDLTRRDFIRSAAAAGVGLSIGKAALATARDVPLPEGWTGVTAGPIDPVRVGFVGTGRMGTSHVRNLARIEGCEVRALADINEANLRRAARVVTGAGHPEPDLYTGPEDYLRIAERDDIDLIYTATPWELHVPVCVAAMEGGKHAATEIPAALTLEECWQLVETSERTNLHCCIMENCCYGRFELMALNMARRGVLGELMHAECAYNHDLRRVKLSDDSEGLWRWQYSVSPKAGNNYPMHGLGPVAWYMNVGRGDYLDYMVSMSGPARGLNAWTREHLPPEDPRRDIDFQAGDVNVSLIKTAKGRTIYLVHDTNLPRPYTRINMIQGTRGLFSGYPNRVHIEGRSPGHRWEDVDQDSEYMEEFGHELWSRLGEMASGAGHGGMDFIEDYRLIRALRLGIPTDLDVYDAALWSSVIELSSISLTQRSKAVDFPDFTRGMWRTMAPVDLSMD